MELIPSYLQQTPLMLIRDGRVVDMTGPMQRIFGVAEYHDLSLESLLPHFHLGSAYPLLRGERRWICHGFESDDTLCVVATPSGETFLQSLGSLAMGVAHDVNNNLNVILGTLENISTDAQSNIKTHLDLMTGAAKSAHQIVDRIRTYVQPNRRAQWEDTLLRDVVAETFKLAELQRPAHVRLESGTLRDVHVRTNPAELSEVLLNLILNAFDAITEPGTVTVHVLEPAQIQVQDSGEGISPEDLSRIFLPYFTTKKERGTGIGLSTSHQLAKNFGAQLQCESEVGVGTTFTLTWTPPSARSIVLVDDDEAVLNVVADMLQEAGHTVIAFLDAKSALAHLEKNTCHLLLVDLDLKTERGTDVARTARGLRPEVTVGLMTGWPVDPRDQDDAIDFVVEKPFTTDDLLRYLVD